jgi:hypothetical protein
MKLNIFKKPTVITKKEELKFVNYNPTLRNPDWVNCDILYFILSRSVFLDKKGISFNLQKRKIDRDLKDFGFYSGSPNGWVVILNKDPIKIENRILLNLYYRQNEEYKYDYITEKTVYPHEIKNYSSKKRGVLRKEPHKIRIKQYGTVNIIGFVNISTLQIYPYVEIDEKDIQELKNRLRGYIRNNIISTGIEMEYLFENKDKIIRADTVLINDLKERYKFEENDSFINELINHRSYFVNIFKNSAHSTDSRRVIAEFRTKPYNICIKSTETIRQTLSPLLKEINLHLEHVKKMKPSKVKIVTGGGRNGETISTHIHFGIPLNSNFVKALNKLFGLPVQNMKGGARPRYINPPDSIEENEDNRQPNPYGIIGNSDQVRIKPWGFEWRILPSIMLNKTFIFNLLYCIFYIIYLDKEEIEIDSDLDIEEYEELKYFTKVFDFNKNIFENYTSNLEIIQPHTVNLRLEKIIREKLKDYIPPKKVTIKVSSKKRNIITTPSKKDLKILQEKIPYYVRYEPYNVHSIYGNYTINQLVDMIKIILIKGDFKCAE